MSKLTNVKGLPAALGKAMESDPYSAGDSDYTATSLLRPVQMRALEQRYREQLQEDVEDGLYRLYGQVAHGILERANMADLAEKRFFSVFVVNGKEFKVSAQLDTLALESGALTDFKFTTSWGFKEGEPPKAEWVAQLNIQLELLRRNGLDAKALQIVGLLRDWQISQAKSSDSYPQAPVAVVPIQMWSREQTVSFIELRIAEHEAAKMTPDQMLPECSFDERFAGKESWAVVKKGKGGKDRAISGGVQYSQELAETICAKNPGTRVQYRREDPCKRCENYCSVSEYCQQFKRLTANEQTDAEEKKDAV
jgi:hypothetical protein